MTDRPIIFSGPMVQALLEGRKTQTRRLATSPLRRCEVGDRLWVRECFIASMGVGGYAPGVDPDEDPDGDTVDVIYRADDGWNEQTAGPWTPSIHMPRAASRLTLIVEGVRVEPLQAISEEDSVREGVHLHKLCDPDPYANTYTVAMPNGRKVIATHASAVFRRLWEALHGEASWESNPDVLVLTFRVERANIDSLGAA